MNKMLLAQLGLVGFIWVGMSFFYNDMSEESRWIYYLVTSWVLFLMVMVAKDFFRQKKKEKENN